MKLKKKILILFFFIVTIILFTKIPVYAGYQEWNSLDYDVTINEDGSMNVIETWNVHISETNTLFKDFDIGTDNYNIKDVKVTRLNGNEEIPLNQIYVEQYHVDRNCYYGLMIDSSTFEIAWNVGLDNSSDNRIYKMYYTVENAVKIYDDCTELYWQFLSDENTMTGDNITGRIRLPNSVSDIEKLRVWGHGDYTAEIKKDSQTQVSFTQPSIKSNKMLEIRVVTEENIFPKCINKYSEKCLEQILGEEQIWADEANREREEARNLVENTKKIIIAMVIINLVILMLFMKKRKKYKAIERELKETYSYEKIELEYFRDIPDESNATPARASYLCTFKKNNSMINQNISKIFSATMLNLSLKGLIKFEVEGEKDVRIYRSKKEQYKSIELTRDEEIIYDILNDAMFGKSSITTKEFSKYASKEYETVYSKLNKLSDIVEDDLINSGRISKGRMESSKKWSSKFVVFMVLAIFSGFIAAVLPAVTIGLAFLSHACRKNSLAISILTEKGANESEEWKGLKKYMEEYSLLNEKLVPDIVLWEKYLVYATAFGISKKVISQLKVVHPEMFYATTDNRNYIDNYAYWYMMTDPVLGDSVFDNFSKSLEKVYNSAQSAYNIAHSSDSSGSGGGGGFSGGGGGRRRRWKLRRSLI